MTHSEILRWLLEEDPDRLEALWREADAARCANVGDAVHLRGLIEISNHCARNCHYCGLRGGNDKLQRYRMTADEILACAKQAVEFGYGTVVMQAGEDYGITREFIADVTKDIKAQTPLAVTLSLGERGDDDFAAWRAAGADRYLLRFETSNVELYNRIHPSLRAGAVATASVATQNQSAAHARFAILHRLREIGYETGSGVMIGIPGQTYEDLARDIEEFVELDLEMIGMGPYLPHPHTPLGAVATACVATRGRDACDTRGQDALATAQVPSTELMTYKMIALARLNCLGANIPSTTALATLNRASGREQGLQRGANIVMPNLTPVEYRAMYEIYPAKACIFESAGDCNRCLTRRIEGIGRGIGAGRGDSPRRLERLGQGQAASQSARETPRSNG